MFSWVKFKVLLGLGGTFWHFCLRILLSYCISDKVHEKKVQFEWTKNVRIELLKAGGNTFVLPILISSQGAVNCDPHGHDGCWFKACPKARRKKCDVGLNFSLGM